MKKQQIATATTHKILLTVWQTSANVVPNTKPKYFFHAGFVLSVMMASLVVPSMSAVFLDC